MNKEITIIEAYRMGYIAGALSVEEDKADNRLDNLQVMTKSEHMSYHSTLANRKKRGDDLSIQ